jgi:hypothetical protein
MQKVYTDESNFSEMRSGGGVYIDKTRSIYTAFKGGKYFFISRPRRFGKSLLCSTLSALFEGKRELFKDLWIDQSDWQWNTHPVIHLDMTRAAAADFTADQVRGQLMILLLGIAGRYGIAAFASDSPAGVFAELIVKLYEKTGKQVVVIIDEYDKPVLDAIDDPAARDERHKILAALYAPLKASTEYLRFVFLTGVFKFTKSSIFSGLNNIKDLTFAPEASDLLGYTDQELQDSFAEHIAALAVACEKTTLEMSQILKEKYNGYCFGVNVNKGALSESVYNPFALNNVFASQQLLDRWFLSGTPTFLIKKLKEHGFVGLDVAELNADFGILERSCSPDTMAELPLLYYAGYVTMRSFDAQLGVVSLDFPNIEVSQALSQCLIPEIAEKRDTVFLVITRQITQAFYDQNLEGVKDLLNQALANIPYLMFSSRESYYQTIIYMLLNMGRLPTIAEDMVNAGRADLVIKLSKVIYILELKMNQSASVALAQIKARGYAEKYRPLGRTIVLVGVELSSEERVVKDMVVEKFI